jgi:hypothetical protein
MMIDRRTFVAGAAFAAIAPSLELGTRRLSADETDRHHLTFSIEGWSIPNNSGATDQVWINLDRSWRASWR